MDIDLEIARAAAERWSRRSGRREQRREGLESGDVVSIEEPERIRKRIRRLENMAAEKAEHAAPRGQEDSAAQTLAAASLVETIGLERVMGRPDFLGVNFLEMALAVSRFVGRIRIRSRANGHGEGFGTGFMVSPRLLLTNNHVLRSAAVAAASEVEFDYQYDRTGRLLPVVVYGLDPTTFFLTDRELDYSLVAVREKSLDGKLEIRRYGWSRLVAEEGKALLGDSLNIIQHPKGEPKQLVLRSNQLVDLFDSFAHYVADTEPGSSGSPVYNDQWEVVALHHAGVPLKENGNLIAKDGSVWRSGMDPENLQWVANEGVRVSSLVRHIAARSESLSLAQRRLLGEMMELEPPNPIELIPSGREVPAQVGGNVPPPRPVSVAEGACTWTIPLQVSVQLGSPVLACAPPAGGSAAGAPPVTPGQLPADATGSTLATPTPASDPELREALAELEDAATRDYYDEAGDTEAREAYYRDAPANADPEALYDWLSGLVTSTHRSKVAYQPRTHVYPWVDLHEDGGRLVLKSIYSGRSFDPREFIEQDFRVEQERFRLREVFARETAGFGAAALREQLDVLEASLPYNCEHVVPQSWFGKREPMRGDLHHLFACETGCNSFRGNIPYYDFPDFEEVVREACGKREELKFEPSFGKGAVARATLYFLLRYRGEINATSKEYREERLGVLLRWHAEHPVTRYERHRNAAISEKQGNRNPLIDHPEWADRIAFRRGLG
jgi:endonuclease I/V8-like Glu-specific endopeptidase